MSITLCFWSVKDLEVCFRHFIVGFVSCLQQAYKSGNPRSGGGVAFKPDQKLQSGFSFLFVIIVGLLGMLVGYLLGG